MLIVNVLIKRSSLMRITKENREKTRRELIEAARTLFRDTGFGATTTRAIASNARIAVGTVFNYFNSKELLGAAVLSESIAVAEEEFEQVERAQASLDEVLFGFVALHLRHMRKDRSWAREVLGERYAASGCEDPALDLRGRHLARVERWLTAERNRANSNTATNSNLQLDLHLYWTLILGVFNYWAFDESHNQEATLALLDRSIELFTRGLQMEPIPE
ncbi:MAG: AcrR family transcriptional regulator [Planctomycetota bacterium]|jgi:AcrR family transcriptional regulator